VLVGHRRAGEGGRLGLTLAVVREPREARALTGPEELAARPQHNILTGAIRDDVSDLACACNPGPHSRSLVRAGAVRVVTGGLLGS
jgi:hypothetical protein